MNEESEEDSTADEDEPPAGDERYEELLAKVREANKWSLTPRR